MARTENVRQLANFIWSVADLLRGDYKQADYGKVILPFTVLRRLDCVLEPTKETVMDFYEQKVKPMMEVEDESKKLKNPDPLLNQKAGVPFHNISQFTFQKLQDDSDNIAANLKNYINGFSVAGREILEYFNFNDQINRSDGSFLFLQHMIAKMKRDNGGSRIAIVFNGSPLFSGSAGSGESDIRKWIIENDMLEAIVALPDQLFYNTGIYTYIWIVTNAKAPARKGKIQLINGIHYYKKMSRSLGNKRNVIGDGIEVMPDQIAEITQIYGEFQQDATRRLTVNGNGAEKEVVVSKIFDNADFGYWRITVERPLRLNFQASAERLARLGTESAFVNLAKSKKRGAEALAEIEAGKALQESIKTAVQDLGETLYKNRDEFETALTATLRAGD